MAIKLWLIFVMSLQLFAHKIEGVNLIITPLPNDMIAIEAKMKGSVKGLEGNKIALISMIDKRVLFEGFLEGSRALHVKIPDESYWVYMYMGDQDVVEEGPAPSSGFVKMARSQKERAFRITFGVNLLFITLFALLLAYRIVIYHKRQKANINCAT